MYTIESIEEFAVKLREKAVQSDWQIREQNYGDIIEAINKLGVNRQTVEESLIGAVGIITQKYCSGYISASLSNAERDGVIMAATGVAAYAVCAKCGFENNNLIDIYRYKMADWSDNQEFIESVFRTAVKAANLTLASVESNVRKSNERIEENVRFNNTTDRTRNSINNEYVGSRENRVYEDGRADGQRADDGNGTVGAGEMEAGNGSSDKFTGEIRKTSFADTDSGEITAVVGNEAERNSDNISVGRTGEVRENPLGNNAGDGERGQRVSDGRYNPQNGIVGKISESSGNSGTERSKDGIIGNAEYKYIRDKKYIKGNTSEMLLLAERLKKESINFSGRINGDETTITVSGYEMRNRAEGYLSEIRSDLESESIAAENKKLIDSFPMQDGLYPDRFIYNPEDNSFVWTYFNPDGDNGNGIFVEKRIDEQDIYAAHTAMISAENEAEGREAFLNYIYENCRESNIDIYSRYFADYAKDYINKPGTVEEYYGIGANSTHIEDITALISRLEDSCAEIKSLTADSDGIVIDGREGTWYVIDTQTIGGKELFLLESENYGDEAASLIVDENRNILMDEVYNGFEDYIEENAVPEGQMIISGEVASEMWYYGFDVYVNGEKLGKYDDVSDKNGIFGRLEDKENTITAAVDDVTLYHTAETIATAVFDISKKYFNAERSISVPYYLNLEKYHEDNDWENWRKDENEYANTMWALLDNNYSSVENYLNNVISDSEVRDNMAEDREAALKAMQTIDVFKAEMEEYRLAENRVTVLPAEEKSYAEQLYTRVNDEYSYFIGQIKKESPEVLIQSAAEIVDKERIVLYLEEYSPTISDEQYEALLSRENPLDEIYEQWVQNGELSSFEDVGIALEETANRILISLDRENSRSEEMINAVLAVSQNDTIRYYTANNVSVDDVREAIASSDKLFTDICALGERQITEAQFAEYSQRNGVNAVDVDIDEQTMHVYGSEKPIVSFEEIRADFDEIAKALDLKNNTITFSVVAIEGEKPLVIGSYIDKDDITALEEYQDYIYDTGRKNIDVTVDYYTIGMGDNESYGADTDEKDFISEHLDEVLKYKYTDHLESETYFIATPAELLEEISEETEKNYLFTVAEFEDGSRYVIPGEIGDDNIKDTLAWQEVKRNNFDIDNVADLDEDIRVTYTVYQTGIGEAVIPTAEEAEKIEASLDEILSDAVVIDTDNSSVRPWDDVDDVISRMEEVWKERHEKEKSVSDGFDNSNFLYPNNLMKVAHDSTGKDHYNFDDAILQIKLSGSEWLRPVDAVIEMNRRGVDINDIEMLNVRYVSSDGTVGEKDVTPEQYVVYLAHSEERTNAFLAAVNAAEERKNIPENIMKIIRDDMPSFVKSAVAWDELMEYDSISEKFDKGEDPVAVVKPYLASNGTFSWNADELKDGYFDWTVKDNGDTAVIFVSVNDSDTFREMYNSHFEVPWTEIADAFKKRIEQELNYNKISDGTITVTAVGEDKFRFSDRSSNTEAIESREQLVERFAEMFNKAELDGIIKSVIDGAVEYQKNLEQTKSKMKEMGIPFSDKPFNSDEKEDIYAYDGSMSFEDFRKRQLLNNDNSPVGNLEGDGEKQIIDLSKLSKITLSDEYERATDQPDDFQYIKNTITFSDLNSSFLIRRNKEFTYDYDVLPDLDEGDTFITRQGMLKEVQDFLEATKSDPDKSISVTDMNGNTTVLKGSQYVFEATEDRLAFVIPDVGYVEISERDDGSYDYAFYDNDFNTTDRGMYNDMDATLRQALTFILKDAGYDINNCTQMDFEELRSRIEEKSKKAMENGTYISPEERAEQDNTPKYEIYQIPAGERYHDIRFTSYDHLEKMEQLPDRFNYEMVYSGRLDDIDDNNKLEGIFTKFNIDRPEDFAGHSLSVSDVIVIEDEKGKSAYFVDDVGFKDITDIFLELDRKEKQPEISENNITDNESARKKSGSEIEVGDKFLYNDREYTVTSEKGIYPDDVGVSYEDKTGGIAYEITSNIDRYKLAENGIFLGNPEKERQTENSPVGNYENADGYEPKIGDLIEYQEKIFKVADVGSRFVTLQTADTLLPETTVVPVTELITSDSLTVIEENVKPAPVAETAEQPAEDKPKAQNFVITDDFGVASGAKTRYADNVAAIKTLKMIEAENRTATPEEQQIIAKYTGWGAIPQAFDPSNEKWSNEFVQLKELLTETEYYSARSSTLNAHYTSTKVITSIYAALENFGFDGGKILEPAMGTGNFFGAMPERISANSQLYGVELDSITGRIAQQLYPKADISVCGYEQTSFEKESFDVAVGNVPFGAYKVNDAEYNKQNMFIHDYFFAKTLDKVRPGGIVAFVTSKGTMDKADESVRKYLAERAELIGAIRLPNTAFKATAGTEVTSDIIFLQKREEIVPNVDEEWIHTGNNPDGLPLNSYFIQHPEMIMGKIVSGNKLYGGGNDDTMCVPIEGENLAERLSEAVKQLKAVYTPPVKSEKEEVREAVSASGVNCYSFAVVDGELYFRENSSVMYAADLKGKAKDRAIAMVEMRDKLNEIFEMQLKNGSGILSGQIEAAQQQLSDMYDRFVDEFGRIADKANKKVFDTDNSYYMLKSLEKYDDNGEYVGKADIFYKMTIKPKAIISHTDRPEDALILSIAEKAKVDLKFMSAISGMTEENLISELKGKMYQNPEKNMQWETADEYLSGNILKKIAAAEAAGMTENADALRAVMPEPVEASDIKVRLGATWIPASDVKDFIIDVLNISYYDSRNLEVTYSEEGDKWKIEGWRSKYYNSNVREIYGTPDITAYEIIEACLNMKQVSIKSNVVDENGHTVLDDKGKPVKAFDADKTTLAQQKQEDIKRKFEDWIFEKTERRERLTAVYNEKFNAVRLREFDGSHLQFTGMNPEITLREHQKNAIARGLFSGNTLLAHEVGAGKTFEMCAIAMEGKRLGLHNKAMIAVPNQLTEQIGEDFRKLYPSAKILVAQKKDFQSPAARKAFTAKIATGNWDGIIIGHSQFERLRLSPEREAKYIQDELDKLREALENCTDKKSFTVKQIERSIKAKEAKLEKILSEAPKDTMIEFEKLGIDKLFIDEAHMYKNLDTPTKMNRVAGLGSSGSTRAMSTLMKCKYMDELTGGKGVIFSTGTPISNSLAEMYTMQRYLQADKLKEAGIDSFDRWASTFGEVVTQMELKPESNGQYQNKSRFCNFINLPELVKMFKECADVKTADTLNLPRPEAEVHNVVTKPTSVQRSMIENLGKRATAIRSGAVQPWEDNMLKITSDGRKIGLDQRVMDSSLPDDPNSKVNTCVDNVYDIWVKNSDKKSTQLIFCDLSTPKNLKNPNHYFIFKQDGDSYVNAYEAKLTPDTDAEAIRQKFSSDKTLPKDFNMDKLAAGDVIVTKIVDSEEGIAEYTAYTVKSGELVEAPDDIYEKLGISHFEIEGKGFSVYDDIKEKLIAKGIPEKEIAFIHDYDTAEEKQELFNKMNSGEIRVMLGSTFKCGAGVNVQKRLIALHDLDCPMRPSDVEQPKRNIEKHNRTSRNILNKDAFNQTINVDSTLFMQNSITVLCGAVLLYQSSVMQSSARL